MLRIASKICNLGNLFRLNSFKNNAVLQCWLLTGFFFRHNILTLKSRRGDRKFIRFHHGSLLWLAVTSMPENPDFFWKEQIKGIEGKIKSRAIVCPLKARIDHDGALNRSHSNPSPFLQSSVQKNYLVIFVSLRWLRRRKKFAAKMSQYVDQVSQRTKITNKRKYFRNWFAARKKLTIETNGWILTGISWPKVMHVPN